MNGVFLKSIKPISPKSLQSLLRGIISIFIFKVTERRELFYKDEVFFFKNDEVF